MHFGYSSYCKSSYNTRNFLKIIFAETTKHSYLNVENNVKIYFFKILLDERQTIANVTKTSCKM